MTYYILIVANDIYFKLLEICLKSIVSSCDLNSLKTIFIADIGLSLTNKEIIKKLSDKIVLLDTEVVVPDSKKIHSKEWVDAVSQKTRILAKLIEEGNIPIVMMDSDMIILEDFSGHIDRQYDIQVCRRSRSLVRPDGLVVNYIASFFAVNNKQGLVFINNWINRMGERIALNMFPPHETPAMVEVLAKENECEIGFIEDKIISCENNYIKNITKIIHAKGRTKNDHISIFRFANIRRFPYKKCIYLFKKDEKLPFTLVFLLKKIFNFYGLKELLVHLKKTVKHIFTAKNP
jgi:hypothetical protein